MTDSTNRFFFSSILFNRRVSFAFLIHRRSIKSLKALNKYINLVILTSPLFNRLFLSSFAQAFRFLCVCFIFRFFGRIRIFIVHMQNPCVSIWMRLAPIWILSLTVFFFDKKIISRKENYFSSRKKIIAKHFKSVAFTLSFRNNDQDTWLHQVSIKPSHWTYYNFDL